MKHKDEISICKTCDKTVSESHPLFSQRMKNPDHNVVKYLPSSSVKELVEALKKIKAQYKDMSNGDIRASWYKLAETALKPFEDNKEALKRGEK